MGQWQNDPFAADEDQRATRRQRPPASPPHRPLQAPATSTGNQRPSWLDDAPAPPFPDVAADLPTRRMSTPAGSNASPSASTHRSPGSSLNISRSMRRAAEPGASGSTRRVRTLGDAPTALVPTKDRRALATQRLAPGSALIPVSERMVAVKTRARPRYRHTMTTVGFMLVALVLALIVAVSQSLQAQPPTATLGNTQGQSTPPPSGSGPWTVTAGALIYLAPTPKPTAATYASSAGGSVNTLTDVEPCHGGEMFLSAITQWSVPPGCYSNVFVPNPANYPARAAQGYCNWWVEENHLSNPNITQGGQVYLGTKPIVGAAVFFQGGVQGASAEGHWAQLVAIAPGGYWLLISEMNFSWRGAGFGRVDYRYVHVGPGVSFYK